MTVGGLGSLFGRALDGINVSAAGMNTVSNNIANVNTKGYARQQFVQGTRAFTSAGGIGGGVIALGISNIVDPFVERQLLNESSEFGKFEGRRLSLSNLENIFYESDDEGIGSALSQFFNSWSELSSDPANATLRRGVLESGSLLASRLNSAHTQVQNLRQNSSNAIDVKVGEINSYLQQLAQLNSAVRTAPDDAGRLEVKNQRQLVLRQLSKEVNINYFENSNEEVVVQLVGTGVTLVASNQFATLSTQDNLSEGGTMSINTSIAGGGSGTLDVTSFITGGTLGGQLTDRNTTFNQAITDLNNLAYQVASDVNAIHANGYGLDNTDGRAFFTPLANATGAAAAISVDAQILVDTDRIAAAQDAPSVSGVGDNRMVLQIIELQNQLRMDGGSKTYSQFFGGVVGAIGVQAGSINSNFEAQNNLLNRLEQQRENISGVNLDEEAADLIKYQRAFEGSARVLAAANEILDTLLGL